MSDRRGRVGYRRELGRRFRGLTLAILMVVCGGLAGACGSSGGGSSGAPDGTDTGANRSGAGEAATITWAKSGEVTGLDPHVQISQATWDILYRVYEPLLQARDDGTIAPLLAASWKRVTPVTYDFELRHDVRFSDGRRMSSADVVASFERVLDPTRASFHLGRLGVIDRVEARGRHGVRFTLKRPASTFLPALAGYGAVVLPGKELKAGTFDPEKELLGTGPYEVEKHLQNESWTLVRNPYYWQKGLPKIQRLVVLILNDPSARIAALRSGRADIMTSAEPDTPSLVEGTPDVRVVAQNTSDFYVMTLNAIGSASKARDERVRQAVALALDRQQIIDLALGGAGEVVAGAGTVPRLPDACEIGSFASQDVERARGLVSEANADGLKLEMPINAVDPIYRRIGQVIQAQLRDVGLEITLVPLEAGAWQTRTLTEGDFDTSLGFWTAYSDNWFGISGWSPSTVLWSKVFGIDDPEFTKLLDTAGSLDRGDDRQRIFQRMCEMAATRADLIPLATRTVFVGYRTDRLTPPIHEFETEVNTLRNVAEFAKG